MGVLECHLCSSGKLLCVWIVIFSKQEQPDGAVGSTVTSQAEDLELRDLCVAMATVTPLWPQTHSSCRWEVDLFLHQNLDLQAEASRKMQEVAQCPTRPGAAPYRWQMGTFTMRQSSKHYWPKCRDRNSLNGGCVMK